MFGMFIHANVKVKLGKLKYIINSPELHLWHHANYQEVFHANFSTKFAIWDHLFGTAYDPGHAPGNQRENWGLGYEYPKDYFLQHAFSVKRFNENNLLKYRWFKRYYNLRPAILSALSAFWKKSVPKTETHQPEIFNTPLTPHQQEEILQ
jgi:hypothetical protein